MNIKFYLTLLLGSIAPSLGLGHDNYVPVGAGNGELVIGTVFVGVLNAEPFGLYANNPGFEIGLPVFGVPAGTQLQLDILSELIYWDGDKFAETNATLAIESPTIVQEFDAMVGSQAQLGLTWGTYPDTEEPWHLDGSYTLTTPTGDFPSGLYGVSARLNSPSFGPSEVFSLSFLYDEGNMLTPSQESDGRLALIRLAIDPQPGDYHLDESIDDADHTRWADDFGQLLEESSTGADGSGDGLVGLADYTLWRDNLSSQPGRLGNAAAGGQLTVPEPTAGTIAVALLLLPLLAGFR